jgi:CHAT domain-containing protein
MVRLFRRQPAGPERADDKLIRRYLLGTVSEVERTWLENRLMAENSFLSLVEMGEDELIDAYLGGVLSRKDRERFVSHFLAAPEHQRKFRFAKTFKGYVESAGSRFVPSKPSEGRQAGNGEQQVPTKIPRLRLAGIFCIALISVATLVTWRVFFYPSDLARGLDALNRAFPTQRPFKARVSALAYTPYLETRGAERPPPRLPEMRNAERFLGDYYDQRRAPDSEHGLGLFYLANGELDKAISLLTEAVEGDPANARFQSDLGAALMENAEGEDRNERPGPSGTSSGQVIRDLAGALEHFDRAVKLEPKSPEALFNRALCLQRFPMILSAEEAWKAYLAQDGASAWAQEATQGVEALEEKKQALSFDLDRIMKEFDAAYRARDDGLALDLLGSSGGSRGSIIVEKIVDGYLDLKTTSADSEASERQAKLEYIAGLEAEKGGDQGTANVAKVCARLTPPQLSLLKEARSTMSSGHDLVDGSHYGDAIEKYQRARFLFEGLGDAYNVDYVDYRLAYCYLREPELAKALGAFKELAQSCRAHQHYWLLDRTLCSMADTCIGLNAYSAAVEFSLESLSLADRTGDLVGEIRDFDQLAVEDESVGKYEESLPFLESALRRSSRIPCQASLLWLLYDTLPDSLARLGFLNSAVDAQREAVMLAEEMQAPLYVSRGYAHISTLLGKLEDYDRAMEYIHLSVQIGESLKGEKSGSEILAYAYIRLGDLHRGRKDYDRAIDYYDRNLEICSRLDFPFQRFLAHKGRLQCYIALEDSRAEHELSTTLMLLEEQRGKIVEESSSESFFDAEQEVYDTAVDFTHKHGDDESAFNYSEGSRARTMLNLLNQRARLVDRPLQPEVQVDSVSLPASLAKVREQLQAGVQILEYAAVHDRVIIWLVSRSDVRTETYPIAYDQLEREVTAFLGTLKDPSRAWHPNGETQAQALYKYLVAPVASSLRNGGLICVVPDKILNYLPFGALVGPGTEFLVQNYSFTMSPSSSVFLACTGWAKQKGARSDERALVVGAPAFDHHRFPELDPIQDARTEAEEISRLYHQAVCLTDNNATRERVLMGMSEADVIHLATHYLPDDRYPMLSKMVLSPDREAASDNPSRDGVLEAYEIYAKDLQQTRVVFLSGCQTGIERSYKGEGAIGLARPFLADHVPIVVASLWKAESKSAARLMIDLHRLRKQGSSTADALRNAQIDMLNAPDGLCNHPYYWATFVVLGGYAEF